MKKYRTIIVINDKIYKKIELYRQFLEKGEFGTLLNQVCFISENSVGKLSPTEFDNAENCMYLYGKINQEEYSSSYSLIDEKRKIYQNATFYMLFFRDKYCMESYGPSEKAEGNVSKTFSIGILEEEFESAEKEVLREDLRCISLLSLAMAICKANETGGTIKFETYYTVASVCPDYKNIYYAILHSFSQFVDLINEKNRNININKAIINYLKNKKDYFCRGNYADIDIPEGGLKKFSSYKKMDILQRDMELAYKDGLEVTKKSITSDINIARMALAVEEKSVPEAAISINEDTLEIEVKDAEEHQRTYMKVNPEQGNSPIPEDLLCRPGKEQKFVDPAKVKFLLPLAREFEKSEKGQGGHSFLFALVCALLFAGISVGLYYLRSLVVGTGQITVKDLIILIAIPVALCIASGVVGWIVQMIRFLLRKNVFKKIYNALVEFLSDSKSFCKQVRDYLNVYITVYFNHHIKHFRIEMLEEENIVLKAEIESIRKEVLPAEEIARGICVLSGESYELPGIDLKAAKSSEDILMKTQLEKAIEAKTEIRGGGVANRTVSPWLKSVSYGVGNMNTGGRL